ncbi:MAG: YtxH domain-containing protein [Gemmatimonadota bacterium]|nr:YtxH domain-containing protein [Gemmatimonadota bacterium]
MRDQNDTPHIIVEREGGGQVGSFVVGALVGAGLALLFAPKSGEETQAEIREKARQLRETAEDRMRDAQRNLEGRFDQAREGVQSRFDEVREAVDAGRTAAYEAREDLEERLERSKAAYRAGVEAAREAGESDADEEGEASG